MNFSQMSKNTGLPPCATDDGPYRSEEEDATGFVFAPVGAVVCSTGQHRDSHV